MTDYMHRLERGDPRIVAFHGKLCRTLHACWTGSVVVDFYYDRYMWNYFIKGLLACLAGFLVCGVSRVFSNDPTFLDYLGVPLWLGGALIVMLCLLWFTFKRIRSAFKQ